MTDSSLDREEIPEYKVIIVATYKGNLPLSYSTSFTLYITDINNNALVLYQVPS